VGEREERQAIPHGHSDQDPADERAEPGHDRGRGEPDRARLVWVLQAQPQDHVSATRSVGQDATSKHLAPPTRRQRAWSWSRPSALAQCLLCRAKAVHHDRSLCRGSPIPMMVNHQLESRVREIRTHGSEGGGPHGLPTPIGTSFRSLRRPSDPTEQSRIPVNAPARFGGQASAQGTPTTSGDVHPSSRPTRGRSTHRCSSSRCPGPSRPS